MFELVFFLSLLVSATIVYFIRKKLAVKKLEKEKFRNIRQKDIKKQRKQEERDDN
jgi:hypothetical protein